MSRTFGRGTTLSWQGEGSVAFVGPWRVQPFAGTLCSIMERHVVRESRTKVVCGTSPAGGARRSWSPPPEEARRTLAIGTRSGRCEDGPLGKYGGLPPASHPGGQESPGYCVRDEAHEQPQTEALEDLPPGITRSCLVRGSHAVAASTSGIAVFKGTRRPDYTLRAATPARCRGSVWEQVRNLRRCGNPKV